MGLKMRPRRRLNMRKALSIIAVAAIVGFGLQIMGGPTETIAAKEIDPPGMSRDRFKKRCA